MSNFEVPVELYMSSPVFTVEPQTSLDRVQKLLADLRISSLPVTDGRDLVGVVSRSDLLRAGRRKTGEDGQTLLELPDKQAADIMTNAVATVGPESSVSEAAGIMVRKSYHRVFVCSDERLIGVLSTKDVMATIRDKRIIAPVSEFMSTPLLTVEATDPISLATERLEKARVSGLVVVEDGDPVGLFTQIEALESRDLDRSMAVEEVMNTGFVCMPEDTRIHRAAAQALGLRSRRVVAVRYREMSGLLTGLDFARCAAK
jgi:CBS domain-containing protein